MAESVPNGHAQPDDPTQSPGAGPSRLPPLQDAPRRTSEELEEEEDFQAFWKRQKDYLELQQSVQSSTDLLSSLSSYLSTFQTDLTAVSSHLTDLQSRSSSIDAQLTGRHAILPPLHALITDVTLPPSLVLTIRDTQPASNPDLWLQAVVQLEAKLVASQARLGKVKAVAELEPVLEGLKLKALTQLPPFLLSLIRPLRSASKGLSTNLAVLQTSLLLKYQPFYAFLSRQAPRIAKQVERGYVNAARGYYETAFRRYARALGLVKARVVEKGEMIGVVSSSAGSANGTSAGGDKAREGVKEAYERLRFAGIDVEGGDGGVVLAYMADDKDLKLPAEALFRSLSLVLLDNASAEFTFLVRFFARALSSSMPTSSAVQMGRGTPTQDLTPAATPSATPSHIDALSDAGTRLTSRRRATADDTNTQPSFKEATRLFHEIFDPALEYCSAFFDSLIASPAIPLLTMIRLNDRLLQTCESRGTLPLSGFLQAQKMALWPAYTKEMDAHVESLKRLADEAEGKGLAGMMGMGRGVKDGQVRSVAERYAALFGCVVALSDEAEEGMLFSSMTRLRAELIRLAQAQAAKIKAIPQRHSFLSSIYEIVMHELVSGPGPTTHPRLQSELSFFRTREEEARRRIAQ